MNVRNIMDYFVENMHSIVHIYVPTSRQPRTKLYITLRTLRTEKYIRIWCVKRSARAGLDALLPVKPTLWTLPPPPPPDGEQPSLLKHTFILISG